MATRLTHDEVFALWLAGGGAPTAGILTWFAPPVVEEWTEEDMDAGAVGAFRLMGGDPGGLWESLTGGTHRVSAVPAAQRDSAFGWNDAWTLIAVCDPETGVRVLLDGNKRAVQLQLAVDAGAQSSSTRVRVVTGKLNLLVVRFAKAVAPLWR